MIEFLIKILVKTPFYPHWLNFKNALTANKKLYNYFSGKVLETGAGNCENKATILQASSLVTEYLATDYTSWNDAFEDQKNEMNRFGKLTRILYGRAKDNDKLDGICSALDLPYESATFDVYCSFEVIEHIEDLDKFFSEAFRVLKKDGYCIITSPFLFRDHGGIEKDFQRLTMGGYYAYAKRNNANVEAIYTSSYLGTTLSILVNQFIIRRFIEGTLMEKLVFGIVMVPFFFMFNTCGYILDKIYPDVRFASRYHVVMKK